MAKRSPVNILVGPARSGKATLVRRRYLELVVEGDASRVLLLVPTAERRMATLEALVRDSGREALLGTEVWTFPQYAEHLLDRLGTPARRTTTIQRFALLREALDACRGEKSLRHMLPIADTPGLLDTLDRFIHTLKTHEIHPDDLSRKTARGVPALKDAAAVYSRYQSLLTRFDLYDDAGLFWQTKDALAGGGDALPWPEVVLVDGFQDFSPPERDILAALRNRGAEITITLPCQSGRPRVFAWTQRTLDGLSATFGDGVEIADSAAAGCEASSVAGFAERLFDDEATALPSGAAADIAFIEAAGRTREVEAIARHIKRIIRDQGRTPGDIAVITRGGDPYGELIAAVFPRYGLPLGDAAACSLSRLPLSCWLLALVRLPLVNFRYSDVAAVLRSPYFSYDCFDADAQALGDADRLLFTAGAFEGLDGLTGMLRQVAGDERRRAERHNDDPERATDCRTEADSAETLAALLERIAERLASLSAPLSRSAFAVAVLQLIDDLHLADRAAEGDDLALVARDLASLDALRAALQETVDLADWTSNDTVPLASHVADVERTLRSTTVALPSTAGGVRVMDVSRCRALSFPVVVLPGLNEGSWPPPAAERLLEVGRQRPVLESLGLPVGDPKEHAAEERFLFYMAVTRAADRVILTRPASDEDGRPQLPSQFWDEARRIVSLSGDGPVIETVSSRDAEIAVDCAGSRDEVRRAVLASLSAGGKTASGGLAALLSADTALPAILDSVAVARARESSEAFGRFDGVIAAADILGQLEIEFPGKRVLSISRLEHYAQCPFRFFATTVLRLSQWQLPEEYFLETDVGLLYHDTLCAFFRLRQRRGEGATRLAEADGDELQSDMRKAVERVFAEREAAGVGTLPALWSIQKDEITERLLAYVAEEADRCRAAPVTIEPAYFEWGFGLADAGDEADPESAAAPLEIASPHGPVQLRGRVDRVDLLYDDGTLAGLAVVDYKSGSKPGGLASALRGGRLLQLPLYLLAAEAALGKTHSVGGTQAMYAYLRQLDTATPIDFLGGAKKQEAASEIIGAARESVATTIGGIRLGQFAPTPSADCPSYCEFRELCRTARWRVALKLGESDVATDG